MMRSGRQLGTFILAFFALGFPLSGEAFGQDRFVNKERGYTIVPPKGYKAAFSSRGGANFNSLFSLLFSSKNHVLDTFWFQRVVRAKNGSPVSMRMTTYHFPSREASAPDPKLKVSTGRIYRTFKEFAEDKITGFYFSNEKKVTVSGYPATLYEMTFEKLARTPQHWLACSYEIPSGEFAAVLTCSREHFPKYRSDFAGALKSLRILSKSGITTPKPRDISKALDAIKPDKVKIGDPGLTGLDLRTWKNEKRQESFDRAIENLESGWSHQVVGEYLVLTDFKGTAKKRVTNQVNATIKWLDKTFADVKFAAPGPESATDLHGGIIRFSQSQGFNKSESISGPLSSYRSTARNPKSMGFAFLNYYLFRSWLQDRDPHLHQQLPVWITHGMNGILQGAVAKGSKLSIPPRSSSFENFMKREQAWRKERSGKRPWVDVKDMMLQPKRETWQGYGRLQSQGLLRYLLGPGSKKGKTKGFLAEYLSVASEASSGLAREFLAEQKEKEKQKAQKDKMTDEELLALEDEHYKDRREKEKDNREKGRGQRLLDMIGEKCFADWTEKDWKALDKSTASYMSKLAR